MTTKFLLKQSLCKKILQKTSSSTIFFPDWRYSRFWWRANRIESFSDILNEVKSPALNNQRAMIAEVVKIYKLNLHAGQSSHCSNRQKIVKFLWHPESKPGCDRRWPSRDLTMLQSSYTHWRQELMLCDLLMWPKNLSVKVIIANITLEHFLTLTSFI